MATKIRLKRLGRRNRPFFRIVVMDSRKRRDGAPIEELGWYDPIKRDGDNYKLSGPYPPLAERRSKTLIYSAKSPKEGRLTSSLAFDSTGFG